MSVRGFRKGPLRAETAYVRALRRVWRTSQGLLAWSLLPLLRKWARPIEDDDDDDEEKNLQDLGEWFLAMAREEEDRGAELAAELGKARPTPDAVTETAITRQVDHADLIIGAYLDTDPTGQMMLQTADYVDDYVRRELGTVLAINLRKEIPGLSALINEWRDRNVGLIESGIRASSEIVRLRPLISDVSEVVELAHASGLRVEALSDQLRERYGVSNSRANLIARDQVLKLNGDINHRRQTVVGIQDYTWSTSRDERVRKSHQALQGTRQKWISPPSVGHPGQDYQCRCVAIPVPPDWFDAD